MDRDGMSFVKLVQEAWYDVSHYCLLTTNKAKAEAMVLAEGRSKLWDMYELGGYWFLTDYRSIGD